MIVTFLDIIYFNPCQTPYFELKFKISSILSAAVNQNREKVGNKIYNTYQRDIDMIYITLSSSLLSLDTSFSIFALLTYSFVTFFRPFDPLLPVQSQLTKADRLGVLMV